MTKPKEAPETAMVVSHALTGSLTELVTAGDQMSIALAQLQLNGWDSVAKCKAAFWLAHGKGEHPAIFIENHWALLIKGRLTVSAKWQYKIRKLKETVPGFRFKVLLETDDAAKVEMSDGADTHVVEYTTEDARRQGLMGRGNNAWTEGSTREMCMARAVHRAADRLGVGRQVPWVETVDIANPDAEIDAKTDAERAISGAVVVDEGAVSSDPDGARRAAQPGNGASDPVSSSSKGATAPPERPAIMRLSDALIVKYGKQTKAVMLEKATFVYNEMVKANTGVNSGTVFKKVEDIGPVDADLMIEFLEHGGQTIGGADPTEPPPIRVSDAQREILKTPGAVAMMEPDEPPPAESADTRIADDDGDEYEKFALSVKRAKKVFGRKFLVEAPQGSGKYWFVDQATFSQAGYAASIKIMSEHGEVVVGQDVLRQLTMIMIADCDAEERSGR